MDARLNSASPHTVPKPSKWKHVKRQLKRNIGLYIIISPAVLYFLIWHYWPMYGVQIAFKDFMPGLGIWNSPWIGFEHFERLFDAYYFWTILKNTIGISLYGLLIGIPAPILLALLFNEIRSRKLRSFAQSVSYAPHFISVVVAVGILFFFISPTNGVFNSVLTSLGREPVDYLAEPSNFWHLYVWSGIWQGVGWSSLIYSAAISGISPDLYEAAYMDGASKFRRIWHITIPGIVPTIMILSILSAGSIMSVGFEKILLMQNPMNLETSEVISTYMYKSGLLNTQYSFSAAVGLFNNVINFIILIIVNAVARKAGETSLW